ncbi:homoserine kinase [Corallococcus sp. RDP092CA]|uniref:homoserine kinase n=1 Tax=Corallococcus sp. RDP092CA TaxID=3109369 RepID=UPI0035AFA23C
MGRINEVVRVELPQVAEALEGYGLGKVKRLRLCANGIINTNYAVETERGVYLLRIYNQERDRAGIEFELSILEHLSRSGFIVQRPFADARGNHLGSVAGRAFVVLQFIEGEVLAQADIAPKLCVQVGARLAEMENLLDGFTPKGGKPNADYPLIEKLALKNLARLRALGPEGEEVARELQGDWDALGPVFRDIGLPRGVVHADLYYQNVIVRNGELVGFIDFDDSYWGVRFYDLALVMMEFSIKQEGSMELELVESLLTGYLRQRKVSPEERALLFDAMRFLCFKFLGYTAELEEFQGEKLLTNGYIERLRFFRSADVKARFNTLLERMTG